MGCGAVQVMTFAVSEEEASQKRDSYAAVRSREAAARAAVAGKRKARECGDDALTFARKGLPPGWSVELSQEKGKFRYSLLSNNSGGNCDADDAALLAAARAGLPKDWTARQSRASGQLYYLHLHRPDTSQWERPTLGGGDVGGGGGGSPSRSLPGPSSSRS